MNDTYKKQSSGRSYTTYQQKLNTEQQKAYNTSYSKNYNYQRTGFEDSMRTRPQRISMFDRRPIIVAANPMYFGGPLSYGSAFVGMWDMWFLMRASDMFWFHHWNDIYPYRDYFEASKFADMEKRVKALEQQGVVRDESYVDPEVDPEGVSHRQVFHAFHKSRSCRNHPGGCGRCAGHHTPQGFQTEAQENLPEQDILGRE